MKMKSLVFFAVSALVGFTTSSPLEQNILPKAEAVFEWDLIEIDWPSKRLKEEMIKNGTYNPKEIIIVDIDLLGETVILSMPRNRRGVPFTLVATELNNKNKSPKLRPFPRWKDQTIGDCRDLQNVISFEIDTDGRLWVLDAGVRYILDKKPEWQCPPKIVIYDLKATGRPELYRYVFPEEVAPKYETLLVDLALDKTGSNANDWVAYIAEGYGNSIVVFNLKTESSYRIKRVTTRPPNDDIEINNREYDVGKLSVTGVAYDKNLDKVYYRSLPSRKVYSLPASLLRNKRLAKSESRIKEAIQLEGSIGAHADGITTDKEGRLYFGVLEENSAAVWSPVSQLSPNTIQLLAKDRRNQWVCAFTFQNCWLYFTSNRLHQLIAGESLDKNEINNRVLRVYVGTRSYLDKQGQESCPQQTSYYNTYGK